jgi:3-oxosteroid 1-dehydrogenase
MRWDDTFDVVCAGTGLGGLTSALSAYEAGSSVMIVDKAPRLGGICAYSGGEVFHPVDDATPYLRFLGGGYADEAMQDRLIEQGPKAIAWLGDTCGIPWKTIEGFPDYHHPHAPGTRATGRYLETEMFEGALLGDWQRKCYGSPHMPPGISHDELFEWGGLTGIRGWDINLMGKRIAKDIRGMGPAMMGWFIKAALVDREIPCHLSTPVVQVVVEDGAAVGIVTEKGDGSAWRIRARKGVVLAIGGYDWNRDLAMSFEGIPEWNSAVQPTMTGDNHILGGEIGAALAGVPNHNLIVFFGYHLPGHTHEGHGDEPLFRPSWEGGYPHAIWVNRAGERFCDESFYREHLPKVRSWDGAAQRHPNWPPFLIFDQNYRDKYCFGTFMPGVPVPEEILPRAGTLHALGDKLGIDGAALAKTIERFNSFADSPEPDPDFGRGSYPWAALMTGDRSRPNPNLGPLNKPPYYGLALEPVSVGVNAVALKTDEHGRVMHVRGAAIPGLYAVGNSSAQVDIGAGYQSGLANLRGITWGRLAGLHAAGR